jgi:hypothetical protein
MDGVFRRPRSVWLWRGPLLKRRLRASLTLRKLLLDSNPVTRANPAMLHQPACEPQAPFFERKIDCLRMLPEAQLQPAEPIDLDRAEAPAE